MNLKVKSKALTLIKSERGKKYTKRETKKRKFATKVQKMFKQ